MTANDIIKSLDGSESKTSDAVEDYIRKLAESNVQPAMIGFAAGVGARWYADLKRQEPIRNAAKSLGRRGGMKGGLARSEAKRAANRANARKRWEAYRAKQNGMA